MTKTLTDHLREIGDELTSITIDGQPYTCTKTEAVARKMYLLARGGTETITTEEGEVLCVTHKADPKVAKMIREFVDGKAAPEPVKEKKPGAKAGRYDSEISRRLNERLGTKPKSPKRPSIKGKIT